MHNNDDISNQTTCISPIIDRDKSLTESYSEILWQNYHKNLNSPVSKKINPSAHVSSSCFNFFNVKNFVKMNNYRPNYCDLESYFELCDCYNQQLPGPLNSSIPQSYKPCKIHNSKPPANDSCNIHETESQISQSNTNADCDQNSSNPHPTDCSVTDQDKLMYEMRNGCSLRDANGGNVPVYYGNQFQPILAHTAYDKIIGPTVMPPASGYYSSR